MTHVALKYGPFSCWWQKRLFLIELNPKQRRRKVVRRDATFVVIVVANVVDVVDVVVLVRDDVDLFRRFSFKAKRSSKTRFSELKFDFFTKPTSVGQRGHDTI